ncbi:hypothetical protein KIN20_018283 [Parelaphostrongylus tenuis]|uniref:Uncharacterized protein n=1 Tax=Parelaphostrongylus tenuis TaxID=148309 RepID=A0AAD5N0W9_PARTN|nr:hypothetical protein KIN20_018283 [Parelaphostrongylus tenuis]
MQAGLFHVDHHWKRPLVQHENNTRRFYWLPCDEDLPAWIRPKIMLDALFSGFAEHAIMGTTQQYADNQCRRVQKTTTEYGSSSARELSDETQYLPFPGLRPTSHCKVGLSQFGESELNHGTRSNIAMWYCSIGLSILPLCISTSKRKDVKISTNSKATLTTFLIVNFILSEREASGLCPANGCLTLVTG